jgi:hypothetical protein
MSREAFEKWAVTQGYSTQRSGETYRLKSTRIAFTTWQAAQPKWQPIETAPKDKQMFVVIAFDVPFLGTGKNYTTDAYCVWAETGGKFSRWPHKFPPTHWTPLPSPPTGETK